MRNRWCAGCSTFWRTSDAGSGTTRSEKLSYVAARGAVRGGLTAYGDGKFTDTARELMVAPLLAALPDEFWLVRDSAATALGHLGDPGALDALFTCLADERFQVRYAAARSLGDLGDHRAVEPLREVLDTGKTSRTSRN